MPFTTNQPNCTTISLVDHKHSFSDHDDWEYVTAVESDEKTQELLIKPRNFKPYAIAATAAAIAAPAGPIPAALAGSTAIIITKAIQHRLNMHDAKKAVTAFVNAGTTAITTTANTAVEIAKSAGNDAINCILPHNAPEKQETIANLPVVPITQDEKETLDFKPVTKVALQNNLEKHILLRAERGINKIIIKTQKAVVFYLMQLHQYPFIEKPDNKGEPIESENGYKLAKKLDQIHRSLIRLHDKFLNEYEKRYLTYSEQKTILDSIGHEAENLIEQLRLTTQIFPNNSCFLAKHVPSIEITNEAHKKGEYNQTIELFDGCTAVQFKISQNAEEKLNKPPKVYAKYRQDNDSKDTWPALDGNPITHEEITKSYALTHMQKSNSIIERLYFKHEEKNAVKSQYKVDIYIHFTLDLVKLKLEALLPKKDDVQDILIRLSKYQQQTSNAITPNDNPTALQKPQIMQLDIANNISSFFGSHARHTNGQDDCAFNVASRANNNQ